MGKKRIVKKNSSGVDSALKARSLAKVVKKKIIEGTLFVESTYNNTRLSLADTVGNIIAWS
jgi:ribosomal protein S11